ncbi:MAG: hypothetical protein Q7J98_12670 [Kiritimatiellia bacterium]|nr:hypothetical protein [Kiritimatiellia bacterium]
MKKDNVKIKPCGIGGFNRPVFITVFFMSLMALSAGHAQDLTNLFFLHHSVGNGLVVTGNMRETIAAYNSTWGTHYGFWDHGYNSDGLRNPAGEETGTNYDVPDDNTDPDGLFYLWTSSGAEYAACRERIIANHQVIAFKSCYPASHIDNEDTLNTYKNYYLVMREFFALYPQRLFVVMSTPPLHRLDTNATEGYYARAFADWLKSATYLSGHTNIVCFDLFGYLAGSDNFLKYEYEFSHTDSDSHPNALADQSVGPVFARFLIDSAAAYHPSESSIAAPANVSASEGTYYDKVRVAWNAVSGAAAYLVYRSEAYDSSSAGLIATATTNFLNDRSAAIGSLYYYWIKTQKADGTLSPFSLPALGWRRTSRAASNNNRDLDGDGMMDPVVYREANGNWDVLLSSTDYLQHGRTSMGGTGYLAALADFDGDAKADLCLYNASAGIFMAALSSLDYRSVQVSMGGAGFVPEPGDYDGDRLADPVIYSRSSGTWRAKISSAGYYEVGLTFGGQQYRAVPADFDGDGKTDPAVCDEQTGLWTVMCSAGNYARNSAYFGVGTAVPADYDGDGRADPAVYSEDSGLWEIWQSGAGYSLISYECGESGFGPCPGDYDGDGLADPAVYNSATQEWRALFSTRSYQQIGDSLGEASSTPVGMPP